MRKIYLRRNVLTNWRVQLRIALVFLLWFIVFLGVFGSIFVINYTSASSRTDGMNIHDQLMTKMILVQQTKDLALYYGLAAVAYLILVAIYFVVYAHRLTGPVYKITKILEKAKHNREWPSPVHLRKGDAFMELAKALNDYIEVMKNEDTKTHADLR